AAEAHTGVALEDELGGSAGRRLLRPLLDHRRRVGGRRRRITAAVVVAAPTVVTATPTTAATAFFFRLVVDDALDRAIPAGAEFGEVDVAFGALLDVDPGEGEFAGFGEEGGGGRGVRFPAGVRLHHIDAAT